MAKLTTIIAAGVAAFIGATGPGLAGDASYNPLAIGTAPQGAADAPTSLAAVLAGPHRTAEARARDAHRHPAETLAFFGLKPDMTVVEIWPGGGWYMDVIAPFVAGQGQYYGAGFDRDADSDYVRRATEAMIAKVEANTALFGRVILTELSQTKLTIAPGGEADMVLTFRNVHNWMDGTDFPGKVFAAMYRALKPGGILGVVEHRANTAAPQDPTASSGYVREDYVIKLAEEAGFQLVDKAEINANPNDTKDHPKGVWTLPPSLRNGEVDRGKYLAIGESDRMTLKFIKPREGGFAQADN